MGAKAKLFRNGRSQAVRIPKALQFEGVSEVVISRYGDGLLLAPARKSWGSFAADAPEVDDDFMVDRLDLLDGDRVDLYGLSAYAVHARHRHLQPRHTAA